MFDINVFEAQMKAMTPGPWRVDWNIEEKFRGGSMAASAYALGPETTPERAEADAEFIALAPDAVSALIARVRELERGEQHHANIIDRLHSRIDELDNLYRKAMRGDLS